MKIKYTLKAKCNNCHNMAAWMYMPADRVNDGFYCDDCIHRGCSCNFDENGVELLDDNGKPYPCCEYMFSNNGFEVDARDNIDYIVVEELEDCDA